MWGEEGEACDHQLVVFGGEVVVVNVVVIFVVFFVWREEPDFGLNHTRV